MAERFVLTVPTERPHERQRAKSLSEGGARMNQRMIAVLGTGDVGQTLAGAIAEHSSQKVIVGTRDPGASAARKDPQKTGEAFGTWLERHSHVDVKTYADAAAGADLIVNATNGVQSLAALEAAGTEAIGNKILIDVANPLDFSDGFPPKLSVSNTDSLGEQIQRAYPNARVVKALNTMNNKVMVAPESVAGGDHDVFVCGDDKDAKADVSKCLQEWFGWHKDRIVDLGGLNAARGTEAYLLMWVRMMGAVSPAAFNIKIQRSES